MLVLAIILVTITVLLTKSNGKAIAKELARQKTGVSFGGLLLGRHMPTTIVSL
jgi:hypothetical protein